MIAYTFNDVQLIHEAKGTLHRLIYCLKNDFDEVGPWVSTTELASYELNGRYFVAHCMRELMLPKCFELVMPAGFKATTISNQKE